MAVNEHDIGRIVVAITGPGEKHAIGQVVSYCDSPMATINRPDGTQIHWRADMCRLATDTELEELVVAGLAKTHAEARSVTTQIRKPSQDMVWINHEGNPFDGRWAHLIRGPGAVVSFCQGPGACQACDQTAKVEERI